jgi:hypothetical protein
MALHIMRKSSPFRKWIALATVLLGTTSPTTSTPSSSCLVERDDIRFFGSGGDAGRVELCHNGTWRYVCASGGDWSLETAKIACRQLGYSSAFMANTALNMAFAGDSGVVDAGVSIKNCQGDEQTLRDCKIAYDDSSCTLQQAVAAACSTASSNTAASTYPVEIEQQVQRYMEEMATWEASEKERVQQQQGQRECVMEGSPSPLENIPTPFDDAQAIKQAYLFPEPVVSIFKQILLNRTMIQAASPDLHEALSKIRWNAFGMDFTEWFPPSVSLEQVQSMLRESPSLEAIKDMYLSANRHNAIHWFLDSPYRFYSVQLPDPTAQKLFDTLQRDGIVVIDDFGADFDGIVELAEASLTGEALYRKNETSIAGGGSIITSRRPIPQVEDLLIRNKTLASVINAYMGPSILHGYKVTRLTQGMKSTDQYNAGMYHHDRVGRRLKLFVFLNDVDCEMGHPTKVAAGSQNLLYYKSEDYPVTRFTDEYVEKNYEIIKGCGKRGGGFLFDTHTIHKGTVEGDRERTVVIAEYHHVAKCAFSKEYNMGIPCPAGDIYRADTPLTTV